MASEGYPGDYRKGLPIRGLDEAAKVPDVKVFHAGTARRPDGQVVTDGGRVLGVTALGSNIATAKLAGLHGRQSDPLGRHLVPQRHRRQGAGRQGLGTRDKGPGVRGWGLAADVFPRLMANRRDDPQPGRGRILWRDRYV